MLNEFKTFLLRGNIIELATGVIIGAAFGKIVNSMVNDILMPPLGLLIGNVDFVDLKILIGGDEKNPVTLNYGSFIQTTVEFLIIAFCIFFLLKIAARVIRKEEVKNSAPPLPSKQEVLLEEIRDLLKSRN